MKLTLRENAITDMKSMGIINIAKAKEKLRYYPYYLNIEDCTIKEIERPKTYAKAKKNRYPIIGVSNMSLPTGWRTPRIEGPAVSGIFGMDDFSNVDGENKVTLNFSECEKFYEIAPINPDTYKSSQEIHNQRVQRSGGGIHLGNLNDKGEFEDRYGSGRFCNRREYNKAFTSSDINDYDPTYNKVRYTKLLSQLHLDKYKKQYVDACDDIKLLQDEVAKLGTSNLHDYYVRSSFTAFLKGIANVIDILGDINNIIDYIAKGISPTIYNDTTMKNRFNKFTKEFANTLRILEELHEKESELNNKENN